ncbi:major pollen allergen Ole e 10-like [Zingiber officinale]|nr:major pollen allergen Ole e 10-like [Zingiber officinale]
MKKNRKEWAMICGLLMAELFMVMGAAAGVQEKAEAVEPIPTMSPPEGNTTFIEGRTWCVARPGASQFDLENAIAWACGLGGADCSGVQPGAACYRPDTLLAHASFAFNSYYQQNGNSDVACYFGGTAAITTRDPSYGSCKYLASETSAASRLFERDYLVKKLLEILVILCLNVRLGKCTRFD